MTAMFYILANTSAAVNESTNALTGLMHTFGVRGDLLCAQIINFCLVAYVLYRFALKPVLKTVEERQQKISEGLQYAETMKAQLASAEQERIALIKKAQEDAQALFDRTKAESQRYLQEQKKVAEEKVNQMVTQAQSRLAMERKQMMTEAKAEIVDLVMTTTERILKETLTEDIKVALQKEAAKTLKDEHNA